MPLIGAVVKVTTVTQMVMINNVTIVKWYSSSSPTVYVIWLNTGINSILKGFTVVIVRENFSEQIVLERNEVIHLKDRPQYTCQVCGTKYLNFESLREHNEKHDKEQVLKECNVCGKKFKVSFKYTCTSLCI